MVSPSSFNRESSRPARHTRFLVLQGVAGTLAIALLLWELGWAKNSQKAEWLEVVTWALVLLAAIAETGLAREDRRRAPVRRALIFSALLLLASGRLGLERPLRDWISGYVSTRMTALGAVAIVQLSIIIPFALRVIRFTRSRFLQFVRPGTFFAGSFFLAILAGTLLLKTPNATVAGIGWLDAFFTSTSAVCVTGLTVVNTETALTQEGRLILLILIQIGGLGIMTLTYFMALMVGHGITLRDRVQLREVLSEEHLGKLGSFVKRIIFLTFLIEALGAIVIFQAWRGEPPREGRLFWDAVFHSVSAFCNAGFSTFSGGLADPAVVGNRVSEVAIMVLIVAGGIGFAVLRDFRQLVVRTTARILRKFFHRSLRLRLLDRANPIQLHTRLTLRMTAILLVAGALLFLLTEGRAPSVESLWEAVFNSVTVRTAGFNVTDFGSYGFATVVLLCALMFIGGSPGGTAGGVKTTTFAIALGELWRLIRGHRSLHFHNRRVSSEVVERCTATIVLSLLWVGFTVLAVSRFNPELASGDVIFECFSAFATVGLTRGITEHLSPLSKLVLIASMFAGRIGLLTLILTLAGRSTPRRYELPSARFPLN